MISVDEILGKKTSTRQEDINRAIFGGSPKKAPVETKVETYEEEAEEE